MEKILRFLARKAEIHTIRTKLIISFLIIAILPLTIMTLFSYQVYFGSLMDRASEYSQEVVNRMARDLDDLFSDIETVLTKDQDFYIDQFIKLAQGTDFNNRKYAFRIWEDFSNIQRVKPGVEEIALVFSSGNRLSNLGLYSMDFPSFFTQFKRTLLPQGIAIFGSHPSFLNRPVVTIVKPYPSPAGEHSVFISADINLNTIAALLDVKLGRKGYIFLADSSGQIIYHPDPEQIGKTSSFFELPSTQGFKSGLNQQDGTDFFLTTGHSLVTGWNVVSVAYADEIGGELAPIQKITLVVVILIVVGVVLLIIYLSHALSEPIKELQNLTQRAANNELDVFISPKGKDEIAQLGHSFNKMINRVQSLMAENVKEQKLLRKLEMESLDNQIKPHFIYNTLDLIIGQLESNNPNKASYIVEALGNFFRLSLSKGKEIVPIANEVEHARNYLFIQQLRHGEEYQYEFIIEDPEILNKYIPRLLLQPLVENAIYHGILRSEREGKITIIASQKGEYIVFAVNDDGQGINQEVLQDINEVLNGERKLANDKEYFGLRNVHRRARLMFGEECGVVLKSEQGRGTSAVLTIKAVEVDHDV